MPVIQPIVFCKAPVPGRVKTRMQPDCSPARAAALHAAMAVCVIERALRLFPGAWIAADDPDHAFFRRFDARLLPQGGGDLGARMLRCARTALEAGRDGVLLLGTDSPHMPEARLKAAVRLLARVDVVLGPVEDGGYDLLAMRGLHAALLTHIPWGGSEVCAVTSRRARAAGLSVRLLSVGFDVDRPADVERARRAGAPVCLATERQSGRGG